MPFPKRHPLRRIQVRFRRPYPGEVGPLGESFARSGAYRLTKRADGLLILELVARKRPERAVILQAVICAALRHFPEASTSDLMDLAGCSRETAHRRKMIAYRINADRDAQLAARRAVARRRPSS
jgi:hypothetical protein